jgi:hypothetical protein
VVARNSFFLSMGFDRRLCNGAPAARFFHEIARRLETADLGESKVPAASPASAGRAASTLAEVN